MKTFFKNGTSCAREGRIINSAMICKQAREEGKRKFEALNDVFLAVREAKKNI